MVLASSFICISIFHVLFFSHTRDLRSLHLVLQGNTQETNNFEKLSNDRFICSSHIYFLK